MVDTQTGSCHRSTMIVQRLWCCSQGKRKLTLLSSLCPLPQQLQSMLLGPLQEMSTISFSDIRYKQLECVLQVRVLLYINVECQSCFVAKCFLSGTF